MNHLTISMTSMQSSKRQMESKTGTATDAHYSLMCQNHTTKVRLWAFKATPVLTSSRLPTQTKKLPLHSHSFIWKLQPLLLQAPLPSLSWPSENVDRQNYYSNICLVSFDWRNYFCSLQLACLFKIKIIRKLSVLFCSICINTLIIQIIFQIQLKVMKGANNNSNSYLKSWHKSRKWLDPLVLQHALGYIGPSTWTHWPCSFLRVLNWSWWSKRPMTCT